MGETVLTFVIFVAVVDFVARPRTPPRSVAFGVGFFWTLAKFVVESFSNSLDILTVLWYNVNRVDIR